MTKLLFGIILAIASVGALWIASDYIAPGPVATSTTVAQNPPNSAEGAPEGSIHNLPVPEAVAKARAHAASENGTTEDKVLVETAFEKEWSDGCLGLGGPAESCIAMITPGWEVTVLVGGETHVYRTNADGSVIREDK